LTQLFPISNTSMSFKSFSISSRKELQLIAGCVAGDRNSQSMLYDLYAPKMMIVCLRYSKNKEEAEEILQNGFLRVFKFIGQYKREGSLDGWIRKIMINSALQKLRNNVHLKPIISIDTRTYDLSYAHDIIEQIDGKVLLQLVQGLSPSYRTVFNLYVFEGMKHREIAELLNISEGTSKSNLFDARAILQKKITANLKVAQ
jgi:RNA polymerase sigma factor (sigma-70 family)